MGIDIAGVFLAVGPFGRIAAFKEMVVDLADAAGAGAALAAYVGLEVGHSRLFRLDGDVVEFLYFMGGGQ